MFELEELSFFCQKFKWNGEVNAILIRSNPEIRGYNFVSDEKDSMQLGVNHYPKGSVVKAHMHLPQHRVIEGTTELLHIDSGLCRLKLFSVKYEQYHETMLKTGDTVLFLCGGHSLDIEEETKIIEIKQGPYHGPAKDKIVF